MDLFIHLVDLFVYLFVHSSGPFGGPFFVWGGSSEPGEPPLATALHYTKHLLCMSGHSAWMADQVELWSDKFQVRLQKLFSSLHGGGHTRLSEGNMIIFINSWTSSNSSIASCCHCYSVTGHFSTELWLSPHDGDWCGSSWYLTDNRCQITSVLFALFFISVQAQLNGMS